MDAISCFILTAIGFGVKYEYTHFALFMGFVLVAPFVNSSLKREGNQSCVRFDTPLSRNTWENFSLHTHIPNKVHTLQWCNIRAYHVCGA